MKPLALTVLTLVPGWRPPPAGGRSHPDRAGRGPRPDPDERLRERRGREQQRRAAVRAAPRPGGVVSCSSGAGATLRQSRSRDGPRAGVRRRAAHGRARRGLLRRPAAVHRWPHLPPRPAPSRLCGARARQAHAVRGPGVAADRRDQPVFAGEHRDPRVRGRRQSLALDPAAAGWCPGRGGRCRSTRRGGAALAPTSGDAQTAFFTQPDIAERSSRPYLQGRLRARWGAGDEQGEVSLGGHYGWLAVGGDRAESSRVRWRPGYLDAARPRARAPRRSVYRTGAGGIWAAAASARTSDSTARLWRRRGGWVAAQRRPVVAWEIGAGVGTGRSQ